MRLYIRAAITKWDLERLYPGYSPNIKASKAHVDLAERESAEPEGGGEDGGERE
jgi:hypothetical protein